MPTHAREREAAESARVSQMELLYNTFSPDPHRRAAAEKLLQIRSTQPGFLPALLDQTHSRDDAALAAALYVKNFVRKHWDVITEHDKALFRAALLPAIANAHPPVRVQLAEALKRVISSDFPHRFPSLLPDILQALNSPHDPVVQSALVALRALSKVYECRSPAMPADAVVLDNVNPEYLFLHPRAAVHHIVETVFPSLLTIIHNLEHKISTCTSPHFSEQWNAPFDAQRAVAKIFWSLTHYELPVRFLSDTTEFTAWMTVFHSVLRRPVPSQERVSEDDIRRMPQWRVKQWAGHIVYRFFQRYGNPSKWGPGLVVHDDAALTRFGDFFRRTFAPRFTETMLEILSWDPRHTYPKVANLALLYLETAVSPALTFKVIRPRLAHLVVDIAFPYLCIHESDLELWYEDPIEYVRKSYDVVEDFDSPRAAACSLLLQLSKQRRSLVVPPLVQLLLRILDSFAKTPATPENREQRALLARQKDGALLAIGTIRESLTVTPESKKDLENLLITYVVPDFKSDISFLRARACWLFGQLTSSESVSVETMLRGLDGVQACLRDQEFPVRVRAAVDIRHFVQNQIAAERIAPNLEHLLQLLFALLDNIDNTDIVATIDQVVVGFSDVIAPYSGTLCAKLVETFSRAAAAGQSDGEAGFAASQCIQALDSIVTSLALSTVQNKEKLVDEMEETIKSIFDGMFGEDRLEFFEESLELLSTFVYHSSEERSGEVTITPYLWSLLPQAMQAFHDWAADYSFHYLHLLESYISKSADEFSARGHPQLLVGMVTRLWEDPDDDDNVIQGGRVIQLYLQHCRVDPSFDSIITSLTHLTSTCMKGASQHCAVTLIRTLAHLTFFSPRSAAQAIASTDILPLWVSAIKEGVLDGYDAKASALALSALLRLDNALPARLSQARHDVLTCITSLSNKATNGHGDCCLLAEVNESFLHSQQQ